MGGKAVKLGFTGVQGVSLEKVRNSQSRNSLKS